MPVSLLVFLAAALGVGFLMHRTVFGRRCYAIGNNKDAAWIAGVDVTGVKISAYALAGGACRYRRRWSGSANTARPAATMPTA